MKHSTNDPNRLYGDTEATGTKLGGPSRSKVERRERATAVDSLVNGEPVVYAFRLTDGVIKIGCSRTPSARLRHYPGAEILAFIPGDYDAEQSFHVYLRPHRARGHEYYHPTPEVLAVVNDMRDHFGLPHIAA